MNITISNTEHNSLQNTSKDVVWVVCVVTLHLVNMVDS